MPIKYSIIILFLLLVGFIYGCGKTENFNSNSTPYISFFYANPISATLQIGKTYQFNAYARIGYEIIEVLPTWEVVGNIGAINNAGIFSPGAIGHGQIKATYQNKYVATSEITVMERGGVTYIGVDPNVFSPNGDSIKDTTSIYVALMTAGVELKLFDQNNTKVATIYSTPEALGRIDYRWDGKDISGQNVPDGKYNIVVYIDGYPTAISAEVTIDTSAPTISGKNYIIDNRLNCGI